jgi:hypothetical protein
MRDDNAVVPRLPDRGDKRDHTWYRPEGSVEPKLTDERSVLDEVCRKRPAGNK